MDPQDLNRLKQHVQARIEELTNKPAHSEGHVSIGDQADDDDATLDVTVNAIIGEQLRESAKRELRNLTGQLAWLNSDHAGICQSCDQPIPLARLEAVPVTRLCIACADKKG